MKNKKNIEYVTNISYSTEYYPVSSIVNVEHFQNGNEIYVAKVSSTTITNGFYNNKSTDTNEYIVSQDDLQKLIDHPETKLDKNHAGKLYFVKKEFLNDFPLNGTYRKTYDNSTPEYNSYFSKTPLTDMKKNSDKYTFVQYVSNENDLKIFKDSQGKMYCEPFLLEYINSQLDNRTYKLDDLVEHLMTRNDMAFIINHNQGSYDKDIFAKCPITDNHKHINKIIEDIPYYNAEDDRNETFTVMYYPTPSDIEKLIAYDKQEYAKTDSYSIEKFILNEIMGAKTFLVAPKEEPAPQPKRKFKN